MARSFINTAGQKVIRDATCLKLPMKPDDEICLCFHISQRKIVNYLKRENPPVASLISECLGAGTGCGWCIPTLRKLHELHQNNELPVINADADTYADQRNVYRRNNDNVQSAENDETS